MVQLKARVRTSDGRLKTIKFKSIQEAANKSHKPYMTVYMRLNMGWTLSQALSVPIRQFSRRYVVREMFDAM
jgi:hypothetical protein